MRKENRRVSTSYFDAVRKHQTRIPVNPSNLEFYVERQLFPGVEFSGRDVLDIGAGIGMFGLYAAFQGAQCVELLEPEFAGSSSGMIDSMNAIISDCGLVNAHHRAVMFQDFETDIRYDTVLIHNAINHLDEESCEQLSLSQKARDRFSSRVFSRLARLTKPGGLLIVTDCGRRNLFGDCGMTSPFAKTIEWKKHQDASLWAELLSAHGFRQETLRYTSFNTLRSVGLALMNNRCLNYLTHSHFILHMRRESA